MKRKIGFLIALVAMLSMMLVPAGALADTLLPYSGTYGAPNSVGVTIADTGDGWLEWTYTYSVSPTHTPKMTVAIDYPSGFCITTFDDSSHTGWYYAPDGGTAVQFSTDDAVGTYGGWVETTAVGNVLTVRIRKSELGLTFMWHGYANVDGQQVWIEMNTSGDPYLPTGEITIDPDMGPSLNGNIVEILAINVYPTSIDFGTITPGTPVSGDTITVTNIGTVAVAVSASIDPKGDAFQYLYLNDKPRTSGLWSAADLAMTNIAPTLDADCTTELQVPATYSARGEETVRLVFMATPATP